MDIQKNVLFHLGLSEDYILFCQNHNVKRLTEMVQANPLLFKVVAQVQKEWTSTSNAANANEVQLSPGIIDFFSFFAIDFLLFRFSGIFSKR